MAVKEISLTIPTDYSTISLKKYLALQKDLDNYRDDAEAMGALILYHLCGLSPEYLKGLSIEDYNSIRIELEQFISNTELPLQRIIEVNGKEYGFEPNLSQMSYGAYADITKHDVIAIDDNWAKVMSILYRPVTKKLNDTYEIAPYNPKDVDSKIWEEVGMDIHFGALFFFVRLSIDLLNSTLKSLTQNPEIHPNIKSILARSGQLIQQSMSWQKAISSNMTQLPKNPLRSEEHLL
jgi:hypothetical protein